MTDELKPVRCGCGGEAKTENYDANCGLGKPRYVYDVYCEECMMSTAPYTTEAEAIMAWNRAMSIRDKSSRFAEMTGSEYQELAMRTNDGNSLKRLTSAMMECEEKYDLAGILNGCLGLSGETGEFCDMIKKWVFHRKPLDEEHAKKELGDCAWYLAMIAHSFGWNLDEILQMNVDKLKARYPEGFSTELSNHRKEGDV